MQELDLTDEPEQPAAPEITVVPYTSPAPVAQPAAGADRPGDADWTKTDPAPEQPAVTPFSVEPYVPEREREQMRGVIALILLSILGVVVIGAFLSLWTGWAQSGDLDTLLKVVFGPLIGRRRGHRFLLR